MADHRFGALYYNHGDMLLFDINRYIENNEKPNNGNLPSTKSSGVMYGVPLTI
jgi:hypothetical protein